MLKRIKHFLKNIFIKNSNINEDINIFMKSQPRINLRKIKGFEKYTCSKCNKEYLDSRKNHLKEEFSDDEVNFASQCKYICYSCYGINKENMLYTSQNIIPIERDYILINNIRSTQDESQIKKIEYITDCDGVYNVKNNN